MDDADIRWSQDNDSEEKTSGADNPGADYNRWLDNDPQYNSRVMGQQIAKEILEKLASA
jgi:hypothetical protein